MKNFLLAAFCLLACLPSFSQDSHVVLKGYVDNEKNEKLMGCALQLFKDDMFIKVDTTGPSGMYKFDSLYVGHVYDIFFEIEGYSLRFARIDLTKAKREDLVRFPVELNMALFSTAGIKPEKLYFLQSEPSVLAKYNSETGDVEWDMVHLEKMKKKTDAARQ